MNDLAADLLFVFCFFILSHPTKAATIQETYGPRITELHAKVDQIVVKHTSIVLEPAEVRRMEQLDGHLDLDSFEGAVSGAAANGSARPKTNNIYQWRQQPEFSGKPRDFPRWLEEWEKEIAPYHGKQSSAH